MADERTRELERRGAAGDPAVRHLLLRHRIRIGDLKSHYVKWAAYLGEPACKLIHDTARDPLLVKCDCKKGTRAGRLCAYCGGRMLKEWEGDLISFIREVAVPLDVLLPYCCDVLDEREPNRTSAETRGIVMRVREVLDGGEVPQILHERAFQRGLNGRDPLGVLAEATLNRHDTQRVPTLRRNLTGVVSMAYDGTQVCRQRQIQLLIDRLLA